MSVWNYTGAPFPWCDFDPEADLAFTFDFVDFVTDAGESLTLTECEIVGVDHGLLTIDKSIEDTVVTLRIKRTATAAPIGKMIPFTMRPKLSDGQQNDWTRLLKLREG